MAPPNTIIPQFPKGNTEIDQTPDVAFRNSLVKKWSMTSKKI